MTKTIILNIWPGDENCLQIKQILEQNYISHIINYLGPLPTDEPVSRPYLAIMDTGSKMYYTLEDAIAAIKALNEGDIDGFTNS